MKTVKARAAGSDSQKDYLAPAAQDDWTRLTTSHAWLRPDDEQTQHKLPPTPGSFYRWQHYTRSANQALLHQQYQLAEQHYQHALLQAEQLRQLDPLAEPHVAAWVISLHNLADLALLNGLPTQARALLCCAYQQLWQLCRQQALPQLCTHLQICRRELAFFCQNFGRDAQCQQLLQLPWPGTEPLNSHSHWR